MTKAYTKSVLQALALAAALGASGALYAAEKSTDKPPMSEHPATQQQEPEPAPKLESLGDSHPAVQSGEPRGSEGRAGDKPCPEGKPSGAGKDTGAVKKDSGSK